MECLSEKNINSSQKSSLSQYQKENQSQEFINNIYYSNSQNSPNIKNISNSKTNSLSNNTLYQNNIPYTPKTSHDFSKDESIANFKYNQQSGEKSLQLNQNLNSNFKSSLQNSNISDDLCMNQYYSEQKHIQDFLKDFSTNRTTKSSISKKSNEILENKNDEKINQIKKNLNSNDLIINNGNDVSCDNNDNNSYSINYNSKINGDIIETDKMNLNEQNIINIQNNKNKSNDLAENLNINETKNPSFAIEQNISINQNNMPKNIYIKNKILNSNNFNNNNNQKYSECYEEQKITPIQKYEKLKNEIEKLQKEKQILEQDINKEKMENKTMQINKPKKVPLSIGSYYEFKEYEKKIITNEEMPYEMENSKDILGEFVDKVIERSYNLYKNRYCSTCAKLLSNGQSTKRCPKNHHRLKNNQK